MAVWSIRRGVSRDPFACVHRPGLHLSRFATRLATATRSRSNDVIHILAPVPNAGQAGAELTGQESAGRLLTI
jgi:hypothetical protein